MAKKQIVFVGISGGVDSSVSAALLLEQGYDVVGVFIKTWQPEWVECTWRSEKRDAMRVCAHLGIPFLFFDFEQEYKKGVADYMIEEYRAGRTPNPDVMCNKEIKFGAFYKKARAMGADFVATGHYAQKMIPSAEKASVKNRLSLPSYARRAPTPAISARTFSALGAGFDKLKDQSYFLWTIPQEVLAHTLFPVGHLKKSDVRKLAVKYKLPTATKKDSQGICFIGPVDMKEFLSHYIKTKQGNVLDEKGEIIGTHNGAIFYTLGERHGFTITKQNTNQAPLFVIAKDLKKNTITVSKNKYTKISSGVLDKFLSKGSPCSEISLSDCNWIYEIPRIGQTYAIRLRYREELSKVKIISISKNSAQIELLEKETIHTPGQSAVLYNKEICLGGGIIE